jgi:hypothetical protein
VQPDDSNSNTILTVFQYPCEQEVNFVKNRQKFSSTFDWDDILNNYRAGGHGK